MGWDDAEWRLIGVPTYENVNPDAVSRMSYLYPISLMPEDVPRCSTRLKSDDRQVPPNHLR